MITVTKTDTRGFRAERFRNQVVHQYYGHLQSVMHSIEPSDAYKNLFARPEIDGFSTENTNIEWTSGLSGKPVHYSQLSEPDKQKVDRFVDDAFGRINKYIAEGRDKTGKEHDYSQFLAIVAKKPNTNQIWIVGGKPTIVQWGYNDDNNLMGSSGIYPNWDSFISDIVTVNPEESIVTTGATTDIKPEELEPALKEPAAILASPLFADLSDEEPKKQEVNQEEIKQEPKPEPKPQKPAPKKPVKKQEEKNMAMAGLGGYWWVKWLAIILLIIIIILLLLRLIPQAQNPLGQMPGMAGGQTIVNGGAGGIGGGSVGGAGGIGGAQKGDTGNTGSDNSDNSGIGSDNSDNSRNTGNGSSVLPKNNCKSCGGTGILKAGSRCGVCSGKGKSVSGDTCIRCSGTGKNQRTGKCSECSGSGISSGSDNSAVNSDGNDRKDTDSDSDVNADDSGKNSQKDTDSDYVDDSTGSGSNSSEGADTGDSAVEGPKKGDSEDTADGGDASDETTDDDFGITNDKTDNKTESDNTGSEDLCPVCRCLFSQHSPEDLKKCLLSAQEGKEEMRKRLQKFVNDLDEKATDNAGD